MWEQGKKVTVVCNDELETFVSNSSLQNGGDHNYNRNFPIITEDMVQQHIMGK